MLTGKMKHVLLVGVTLILARCSAEQTLQDALVVRNDGADHSYNIPGIIKFKRQTSGLSTDIIDTIFDPIDEALDGVQEILDRVEDVLDAVEDILDQVGDIFDRFADLFGRDVHLLGRGEDPLLAAFISFPHYISLDGKLFDFTGTCTNILAESCDPSIEPFRIFSDNNYDQAYVDGKIGIEIYGFTVVLGPGNHVRVNGMEANLPVYLGDGADTITVASDPSKVYLLTGSGIVIIRPSRHTTAIFLPGDVSGKVCGLLGNGDGDPDNDFTLPDETLTTDADTFGTAWEYSILSAPGCADGAPVSADCTAAEMLDVADACGLLTDPTGPFQECHGVIPAALFEHFCHFDYCAAYGDMDTLCASYHAYAASCALAGILMDWRSPEFCPAQCQSNAHHEVTTSQCQTSCYPPHLTCPERSPVSGCVCDAGYILSVDECVLPADCGCVLTAGQNHKQGDVWYEDCTTLCSCDPTQMTCATVPGCLPEQSCVTQPDGSATCTCPNDPVNPPDCAKKCSVSAEGRIQTRDNVLGFLLQPYTKVTIASTGPAVPNECKAKVVVWIDPQTGLDWVSISVGRRPNKPDKYFANLAVELWDSEDVLMRGYNIPNTYLTFPFGGLTDGHFSVSVTEITPGARGWLIEVSCYSDPLMTLTYDPLTPNTDLVQVFASEPQKWRDLCYEA